MGAPNLAWGGYRNGEIPRDRLVDIGGGKLLEPAAAAALKSLAAEFAKVWGAALYVAANQDTYRDLDYQKRMTGTGHHKYRPGTSIHGWARSFDLSGYGGSAKTARHVWLQQNIARFGISWKYGSELGEPWHFDYIGPVGGGASSGGANAERPRKDKQMIQLQVPNGTIADVGELTWKVYTSTSQAFSYQANGAVWGAVQVTPDQMTTLLREAGERRKEFFTALYAGLSAGTAGADGSPSLQQILDGIEQRLADDFAAINANIDDQPTEFTITPRG